MQLYRQELYFKNCKPATIQSRKRGSKIHGDRKITRLYNRVIEGGRDIARAFAPANVLAA